MARLKKELLSRESSSSQNSWARELCGRFWRKPRRMQEELKSSPGSAGALRFSQHCGTCTGEHSIFYMINMLPHILHRKKSKVNESGWKRRMETFSIEWYFLSCDPPIIHGNLTCDTIFIQHNGLVKIGSVAPDAIDKNVKTFKEKVQNFHFLALESAGN